MAGETPGQQAPDDDRATKKSDGLKDDHADLANADRTGLHQAGNHRQDDQAEHVIDDRRAKHDLRLGHAQPAKIAEDTAGDANRGSCQRRPEKQVSVLVLPGQQQGSDHIGAKGKGNGNTDGTDHERPGADLDQIVEPRLQTDLQQQNDHAQLGEEGDDRVTGHLVEIVKAENRQIAQHDSEQQFAEHRRKTDALRQRRKETCRHQDDGQP